MAYVDSVKQWFKTRLKPTQTQFWQTWDWLRWKDEALAITDIAGLEAALLGKADTGSTGAYKPIGVALAGDGSFVFPAGLMLDKIIISPQSDSSLLIGLTNGTGGVFTPGDPIPGGSDYVVTVDLVARAPTTIYFSNVTGPHVILIYTRTLSYDPT